MSIWDGYILEDYKFSFGSGKLILDVGCGKGGQLEEVSKNGSKAFGIDIGFKGLTDCRGKGLSVLQAQAEQIPFSDNSFDGINCKVVLPYTKEDLVISEFSRILKPNGICHLSSHGFGYSLSHIFRSKSIDTSLYGIRTVIKTWLWTKLGTEPEKLKGGAIYQSRRRLKKYYKENKFKLLEDAPAKKYLGFPVFIYHTIQKT